MTRASTPVKDCVYARLAIVAENNSLTRTLAPNGYYL